jgi:multidrug efflux system membrane fusion protein
MKSNRVASKLLVLGAALLTGACGGETVQRQAPEVTVAQPVLRPVQAYADFTGTTRAVESADIRARVGGVLRQQLFEPSDMVDEGEVLFIIEQDQYEAARDEAAAGLRSAVADSALKESNLERVRIAIETNAVSRQDLDRAQAERDAAVAAVLGARARLARAQLDYDYTMVRTPIAGQVGRRLVDPGNLVGYGEQTLLTTVNRMKPIHVYFNAPEWAVLEMLRRMEQARGELVERDVSVSDEEEAAELLDDANRRLEEAVVKVLVGTAADGDRFPFEGYIDFIGNTVDPSTGTIELRAVFENEDRQLFPGLFVRVRVISVQAEERLLVNERALGTDIGGKYLFVLGEGDVVERRYVTVGQPQPDGRVVVEDGLEAGETYISDGLLRARPGLPVSPVTEEQMAERQAAQRSQLEGETGTGSGEEE